MMHSRDRINNLNWKYEINPKNAVARIDDDDDNDTLIQEQSDRNKNRREKKIHTYTQYQQQ